MSLKSGWKKFKKGWNDFWHKAGDYATDFIDDITGKNEKEHLQRADTLAENELEFQQSSHAEDLAWQKEQFAKSQEMAQANLDFQKDVAEKNFGLAQDTFAAQQRENEIARQREDTAYQRQVKDLKAAGLSPLAVSGGAAASTMQVGSAPQYNAQGVTAAQGSMIQLAQEYAQLRNMAQGQYLTRRQAAINERVGAQMALSQLSRERRINFQNMALSTANLSLQYNRQRKENAYTDELIKNAQDNRKWSNDYGWRNLNSIAILKHYGESLMDVLGIDVDTAKEFFSSLKSTINVSVQNLEQMYDGTESGFNQLKSTTEVLKGSSITKDSFDDLMAQLIEPSKVSSDTVYDWYTSMNKEFQDKFTYGYFYDAVTGSSKWKRSVISKYLMFGNGGNL